MVISRSLFERVHEFYSALVLYAAVAAFCTGFSDRWPRFLETILGLINSDTLYIGFGFVLIALFLRFLSRKMGRYGKTIAGTLVKAMMSSYGVFAGATFGFAAVAFFKTSTDVEQIIRIMGMSIGIGALAYLCLLLVNEIEDTEDTTGDAVVISFFAILYLAIGAVAYLYAAQVFVSAIAAVYLLSMSFWVCANIRAEQKIDRELVISNIGAVEAVELADGSYRVRTNFDLRALPTSRRK